MTSGLDATALLRQALGIDELQRQLAAIRDQMAVLDPTPRPAWYTLKAACLRKGTCYNSCKSLRRLQPRAGQPDALIGGRRYWRRETVEAWLLETDPLPPGAAQ